MPPPRIPALMGFWVRLVEPYLVGAVVVRPPVIRPTRARKNWWHYGMMDDFDGDDVDRCSEDHYWGPGSD